ncbi:MAG: metallophosphoesterase [Blautia sp.]|nr:metallophosphoesterase [Blautia sp.]
MLAIYLLPAYIALNVFFFYRLLKWARECHSVFYKRRVLVCMALVYIFLASSIGVAFLLKPGPFKRFMKLLSNYWLGTLMPLTLSVCLVSLIGKIVSWRRKKKMSGKTHRILGALCLVFVVGVVTYSAIHARKVKITTYEQTIEKNGGQVSDLKIALVADIHLGYNIGCRQMEEMRDMINEQNVDLVLIGGDIFDNEYEALEDPGRLAEIFRGINSKYGMYAVYGNHDIEEKILAGFTFGGKTSKESSPEMDQFVKDAGIQLLMDESVLIDDSFYIYGRPDYERPGRGIDQRKLPNELVQGLDMTKPLIVLDHEPRELQELSDAGVDMVLNGHTHDGQMFPGNITCKTVWENSCGYLAKGKMHNIVTSGVGLFGPYMRIGTDAEICIIDVHFSGA